MRIIKPELIKSNISDLLWKAKDELYIVTYTFNVSSSDLIALNQAGRSGVSIKVVTGKSCSEGILKKIKLIPNFALFENNKLHAKIYANESELIVTSCNFSKLNLPGLIEVGIHVGKSEFRNAFCEIQDQIQAILRYSNCLVNNSDSISSDFDIDALLGLDE